MSDYIRRSDAVEVVAQQWLFDASVDSPYITDDDIGDYRELARELFADVPTADRPTMKQTDTLIIADALRYLADDEERHETDRAKARELREQILQYGASMCGADMRGEEK